MATKLCTTEGSWYVHSHTNATWTNYSQCYTSRMTKVVIRFPDLHNSSLISQYVPAVKTVSRIGYGVSLATLLIAFCIFATFKKLRCPRNKLHMHLFVSFIMRAFTSLLKDALFVRGVGLPSDLAFLQGEAYFLHDNKATATLTVFVAASESHATMTLRQNRRHGPHSPSKTQISVAKMSSLSEADLLLVLAVRSYLKKKRKRRFGIHPMNTVRLSQGQFYTLMSFLRNDNEKFFSYFRMSATSFDELLALVRDDLSKQDTRLRLSIPAEERLAVTLRYVTKCDNYSDIIITFDKIY
ncbi:Parathyroid hormone/parathyroid hormone- peptide receptor [Homalodisca vitripennis]|nr:Parathyroid hormone/parathyroid hormone- peptide receptor [Homalodisca vitripennis]